MKSLSILVFFAAAAGALPAGAAGPAPDPQAPILTNGTDTVTVRDFEAVLTRVPEHLRNEARANLENVATMVDEVYSNRVLAREAIEQGLDKDPLVQLRMKQLQESYLASLTRRALEKKALGADFEARAREVYAVNRAKYQEPETVRVQIGTVELECRTPQETLKVTGEIAARAKKGEDLRTLTDAVRMLRDTGRRRFEVVAKRGELEPPIEALAFDKLKLGEVSDPVEVRGGYVVVKLLDKRPGRQIPYEEVRRSLIEDEQTKASQAVVDNKNREIKSDPRVKLDRELLLSLKADVDTAALDRALEDARARARGK